MDVVDATFEAEVMARSEQIPVVVDLWAPWCGPCKSLGPILERAVAGSEGRVVLTKVNIDENPGVAQTFGVQSIPAVFAIHHREVVGSFVGAQGEDAVNEFVTKLLPDDEVDELEQLVATGDEASLRAALESNPDHPAAVCALAVLLVERDGDGDRAEATALLDRVPETPETRRIAAMSRVDAVGDVEVELAGLLEQVRDDDEARQRYLDLLEVMGPGDPRTVQWRQRLTSILF
jgi:putative thioredoxin